MSDTEKLCWYRFIDNQSLLGLIGSVIVLGYFCFYGGIEPFGILPGLILGIVAGVALIMIWQHYAKKGQFVFGRNSDTFRFRVWHFGLAGVFGFFAGIILIKLLEQYPKIDIINLLKTFLVFGCLGLFGLGTIGIFWIQGKYGKRFYLSIL